MRWTLTATLPAAPLAGPGTPIAVFPTTSGLEGVPCLPAAAAAPAPGAPVTCAATTVGTALQGSAVALVFPGPGGALGPVVGPAVVTGPGPAALAPAAPAALAAAPPLRPPPPPILLPPPPSPLIPVPALAGAAPGSIPPGVPVVPEAETGWLVAVGGGGLAAFSAWRRRAR